MWLLKILSSLALCLFLTGCGFHPLYLPQKNSFDISYPLKIATITNRQGQILRNYLVDLLTPGGSVTCPRYILLITLTDAVKGTGTNKDETTSRREALLTAVITLRDPKTYNIVYTHTVKSINSYAVRSQNYYADLVAEEYAKKEAIRLLAEKIKLVITTYFDTHENCEKR